MAGADEAATDAARVAAALRLLSYDMPEVEAAALESLARRLASDPCGLQLTQRQVSGIAYIARREREGRAAVKALWTLVGPWMLRLLGLSLDEAAETLAHYVEQLEDTHLDSYGSTYEPPEATPLVDVVADEEDDDDFVFESMDVPPQGKKNDDDDDTDLFPAALRPMRDARPASWDILSAKLSDVASHLQGESESDSFFLSLLDAASLDNITILTDVALAAFNHTNLSESTRHHIPLVYLSILRACFAHPENGAAALNAALRLANHAKSTPLAEHVSNAIFVGLRRLDSTTAKRLYIRSHSDVFALIAHLSDNQLHTSPLPAAVFGSICVACVSQPVEAEPSAIRSGAAGRLLSLAFDERAPLRSRLDALQGLLLGSLSLPPLLSFVARAPDALTLAVTITREADVPQHALWGLLAATLMDAAQVNVDRKAHFNAAALVVRRVLQEAMVAVSSPRHTTWQDVEDARPLVAATRLLGWLSAWHRAGPSGSAFFGKYTVIRTYVDEYRTALQAALPNSAAGATKEEIRTDDNMDDKAKELVDPEAAWRRSLARWAAGQLTIIKAILADRAGAGKGD